MPGREQALILCLLSVSLVNSLSWGPCDFHSLNPGTVCANVSVPLDWLDSSNPERIYVFLSKVPRAENTTYQGTVFFLNGGSGVGGACLCKNPPFWMEAYLNRGIDFVAPTFRGVGASTPRLMCPNDPGGYFIPNATCAEEYNLKYGPSGMYYWSITQGAHDLNYVINELGGTRNFIQGDGFGTFWGNRFLQIFPNTAEAAVLESYASPNRYDYFLAYDIIDWVGKSILQKCNADILCSTWAGEGFPTEVTLRNLIDQAEQGTLPCISRLPSYMTANNSWKQALQFMFGALASPTQQRMALIPPLIFRLRRCESSNDVPVITHLWNALFPNGTVVSEYNDCSISPVILYNLLMSEGVQIPPPLPLERLIAQTETTLFSASLSALKESYELWELWPKYSWDQFVHDYPHQSTSLLLMNGDLDISTPWAQASYSTLNYNSSYTQVVKLPDAPHVGFLHSPQTESIVPCGVEIIVDYLASPTNALNTTCIKYMKPIDWSISEPATRATSEQLFGTKDAWGYDQSPNK